MLRVLIIGNASSVWLKEYVRNIHAPEGNRLCITAVEELPEGYKQAYEQSGARVLSLGKKRGGLLSSAWKGVKLALYCLAHRNSFDFVELHSLTYGRLTALGMLLAIRLLRAKKIACFWGSDLLAIDASAARGLEPVVAACDYLNVPTEAMLEAFHGFYGTKYDERRVVVKFGSLAYSEIENLKTAQPEKAAYKTAFGLDRERVTIAVGYNGQERQQHIPMLEALVSLPEECKDKMELLLHMPYSDDEDYLQRVRQAAAQSGLAHVIIIESMGLDAIARMRMATDIFLHGQRSDALSGSIRECIYAESVLVNPSWVPYPEYDAMGVEYFRYDSFEELPGIVEALMTGKTAVDVKKNAELVYNNYSWNAQRGSWQKVYYGEID